MNGMSDTFVLEQDGQSSEAQGNQEWALSEQVGEFSSECNKQLMWILDWDNPNLLGELISYMIIKYAWMWNGITAEKIMEIESKISIAMSRVDYDPIDNKNFLFNYADLLVRNAIVWNVDSEELENFERVLLLSNSY